MGYKSFISRLFFYLRPHIIKLILTSITVICAGLLTSIIPEIVGQIVDELFNDKRDANRALFYTLALLGISSLSAIFVLVYTAGNAWVSNQVVFQIRRDMFDKILILPQSYFDTHSTGKILSKLTFDVEQIAQAASNVWVNLIRSLVMVVALSAYLFYKNWQLSLSLIILLPLIYLAIRLAARRMRFASRSVQHSVGRITQVLAESIAGNYLVKIYHAQKQMHTKFLDLSKRIRQQRFKLEMTSSFNTVFISLTIGILLSLVVYFSSIYLNMTAGNFLAFFTALSLMLKPLKQLVSINKPIQLAMAAGESIFTLIDLSPEVNNAHGRLDAIRGNIEFSKVRFSYDNDSQRVLDDISLVIEAGETVAFIGETGSGKSTIAQLLFRFYTPEYGNITIDGVHINDLDINHLREHISLVDQKVRLFDDTVAANIALGQTDKLNKAHVENAARSAYIYNFIIKMPSGFETSIGEDGIRLSGGQRQRLAIARAFAKNSKILILDEATSALDAQTEEYIQQTVMRIKGTKTIIIIAHRLATVQKADKIFVLADGRIKETGNHKTLLAKNGIYARLYQQQFGA